jgi:hypothetical protein
MAIHDQLVDEIREGCLVVAKKLGPGLTEEIYGNALALELEKSELLVARSPSFDIYCQMAATVGAVLDPRNVRTCPASLILKARLASYGIPSRQPGCF